MSRDLNTLHAYRPFQSVLISNRGEIACRIIRCAKSLGLKTIAVYSDADRASLHVAMADEAYYLGGSAPADSYLNIAALCRVIKQSGAEAVHPGYGFLAENPDFAQAVLACHAVWIGPGSAAISAMGNKARAKELMQQAGVKCIPGYEGTDQTDATLICEAHEIGYPIMIKAAAGGGGRGMRRVESQEDLVVSLARARSESLQAFGSSELILERAVTHARHVEIQIAADTHGQVIHLGERDCSLQRRHQKLIEEAPSPAVDEVLRTRMGAMAVRAVRAIEYVGVGTIECLLTAEGEFYFMEMNTRLQVEHAVTEAIYGVDLVAWQFDLAAGRSLPLTQEQVNFTGHAIEVRLTAEDVQAGFLPQSGEVLVWRSPEQLEGIRIDHSLFDGGMISPYYDSMIAKIIAVGATRQQALMRLSNALRQCVLLGVSTNQPFLLNCLLHPDFIDGDITTDFLTHASSSVLMSEVNPAEQTVVHAALAALHLLPAHGMSMAGRPVFERRLRSVPTCVHLKCLQFEWSVWVQVREDNSIWVRVDYADQECEGTWCCQANLPSQILYRLRQGEIHIFDAGRAWLFEHKEIAHAQEKVASSGYIRAPLGARVAAVHVTQGESVVSGQTLAMLEAMKMEHAIIAPFDGRVSALNVQTGSQVRAGTHLLTVEC